MCLEVDHVTQMCTNMAGINSVTSRENDLYSLASLYVDRACVKMCFKKHAAVFHVQMHKTNQSQAST